MTRRINREEHNEENPRTYMQLARLNDISEDELAKKYMEKLESGDIDSGKTSEEIALEEEQAEALLFLENLGLEGQIDVNLDNDPLIFLTEMINSGEGGNYEKYLRDAEDPEYHARIKALNEEEQVTQIDPTKEEPNDDPLLEKAYQKEREKIDMQLKARKSRMEMAKANKSPNPIDEAYDEMDSFNYERSTSQSDTGYRSARTFSGSSERTTTSESRRTSARTETTSYTKEKTEYNHEESQKRRAQLYEDGTKQMLDMVYSGPVKKKKKKTRKRFGGREKFSFKGLWNKTKAWFDTEEAAVMAKIGAMLCLQTGMAIMTKRLEFDSSLQAVSFIGMMLGVFYVGSEVRSEGFDFRRLNFM